MRKIYFVSLSLALLSMSSCSNRPVTNGEENTEVWQTDWDADMQNLDSEIKSQMDSLMADLVAVSSPNVADRTHEGSTKLIMNLDMSCLLSPKQADEAISLYAKYNTLTILMIDREVLKLQSANSAELKEYDAACNRLAADINDPALELLKDLGGVLTYSAGSTELHPDTLIEVMQQYHDEEAKIGRNAYFWSVVTAGVIEQIHLSMYGASKVQYDMDDAVARSISHRISVILNSVNRLAEHDGNISRIAAVLKPFAQLNANSSAEFEKQLEGIHKRIGQMRKSLLEE